MADGSPEINDLEAALEELGRVRLRKVSVNAGNGGSGRLIDMNACNGLTLLGCFDLLGAATTNCWESHYRR